MLDYPLQGSYLAEQKANDDYLLFVHSAIWGLGLSIVLIPLGLFMWKKVCMLVLGHFLIDGWKSHSLLSEKTSLAIDQAAHILQLIACLG